MSLWKNPILVGRPEGNNADGANKGGLVILLQDGTNTNIQEEVGRVAFDREEGAHSKVSFNTKADEVVKTARDAIKQIEGLFEKAGTLQ